MTPPRKAPQTTVSTTETLPPAPHHSTTLSHFTESCLSNFTHLSLSLQRRLHDGGDLVYSGPSDDTKLTEYKVSKTDLGFNK